MAGQLDTALKNIAKQVIADLGDSLDTSITYTRKTSPVYNTSTGAISTTDVSYSIKVSYNCLKLINLKITFSFLKC